MMERFTGQPLPPRPHLAVLFFDAIGDFVVATPLLRGLRERYPGCTIDYFGGERTRELEEASELVDARCSLYGVPDWRANLSAFVQRRRQESGPYQLAINLEDQEPSRLALKTLEPRYGAGLWTGLEPSSPWDPLARLADDVWFDADFLERHAGAAESQYIGEIFCRLALVDTDFYRTEVPTARPPWPTPPLLISTGANRSAKLWPVSAWLEVLRWCHRQGLSVGLLGAPPKAQTGYHADEAEARLLAEPGVVDLRGRLSLPEVSGALSRGRACITVDNGIMHLAAAVGVPTLALFGASPWRLWLPRVPNVVALHSPGSCPCGEPHRFRHPACLQPKRHCMAALKPGTVIAALERVLGLGEHLAQSPDGSVAPSQGSPWPHRPVSQSQSSPSPRRP